MRAGGRQSVSEPRTESPAIAARTRRLRAGAPVVGAHFLEGAAAFVLGEDSVLLAAQGEERRIAVPASAILASACDGRRLIVGGDEGRVASVTASGEVAILATDAKRRWIHHVAVAGDGSVAWAAGKQVFVGRGEGEPRALDLPSGAGGIAFMPKGLRLAIAHYNGASLWFPNAQAAPEALPWKGSHVGVTVSPDGRFVVTAMQEPTLHGWRLADRKDMRMSGYSAKVRSMSWSAGGKWLATSGSEQLILWPFQGKDGPMGKAPRMLAPYRSRLACVACHPRNDVVAVGYEDGLVLLVRIEDGAEVVGRRPGDGLVTALAWDAGGSKLAFGTEDGEAGVIEL